MLVLALESASDLVGAAVADEVALRSSVSVLGRRRHAEALGPAVAHVLAQAQVGPADLDAVAVDVGPGLFTGLRVGVAMANAFGLARSLPVAAVGSLDLLARGAGLDGWPGPVLAVLDARRGQVFLRAYAPGAEPLGPPEAADPAVLPERVRSLGRGTLAVGDGARRHAPALSEAGATVAGPRLAHPDPAVLAALAAAGEVTPGPAGQPATPLYLRPPDVRIGWVTRPAAGRA